ncbi:hypothetical protein Pmgp_03802 [Pelotomaculum propionicicum]|uniref:Uncharacterized protein n=1 Tax=Pelotomaculum propionicicum TaxID=258475 RepID=A0A4Y7RC33_9FIRM|nr:hypothetical protein Pmgp_03802 [Pelotomaculum propionicicum]
MKATDEFSEYYNELLDVDPRFFGHPNNQNYLRMETPSLSPPKTRAKSVPTQTHGRETYV